MFRRSSGSWSEQAYIEATDPDRLDGFGEAVAVSGDLIAISATREGSSASGVNGDPSNNDLPRSGAVYLRRIAP